MSSDRLGSRIPHSERGAPASSLESAIIILPGKDPAEYAPGELLTCEYKIDLRPQGPLANAIETSVLWRTEGKGDTDIGVHFFERREKKNVRSEVLRQTHKLSTILPLTPLSYDGSIVKVVWCIRVRIFFEDGVERSYDKSFRVGDCGPLCNESSDESSDDESSDENEINEESGAKGTQ